MKAGRPPAAPYEAIDEELADLFAEWSDRWSSTPWQERLPALMRVVRTAVAKGSAEEIARGLVRKPPARTLAVRRVSRVSEALPLRSLVAAVAEAFGVPLQRLLQANGIRSVCAVRDLAVWVLRETIPVPPSYPVIGLALGGRDHSTIIAAYRRACARVEREPGLRKRLLAFGQAVAVRSAA